MGMSLSSTRHARQASAPAADSVSQITQMSNETGKNRAFHDISANFAENCNKFDLRIRLYTWFNKKTR
jgi:hypothetical protein